MDELFGCLSCRQNFMKSYDSCSYDRCSIKEVITAPITTFTNTNGNTNRTRIHMNYYNYGYFICTIVLLKEYIVSMSCRHLLLQHHQKQRAAIA